MKNEILKIFSALCGYLFGGIVGVGISLLPALYLSSVGGLDEGFGGLIFFFTITFPIMIVLSQLFGISLGYLLLKITNRKIQNSRSLNWWAIFLMLIFILAINFFFPPHLNLYRFVASPLVDPSLEKCHKLEGKSSAVQLGCYLKVAEFSKDIQVCSLAPINGAWSVRDSCYFYFATENNIPKGCKSIIDIERKHECALQLGVLKDVSSNL